VAFWDVEERREEMEGTERVREAKMEMLEVVLRTSERIRSEESVVESREGMMAGRFGGRSGD
jgi:hypothetical protein